MQGLGTPGHISPVPGPKQAVRPCRLRGEEFAQGSRQQEALPRGMEATTSMRSGLNLGVIVYGRRALCRQYSYILVVLIYVYVHFTTGRVGMAERGEKEATGGC